MSNNQPKPTVLVVDDEQDMREMLAYELSQEGFEVATAESGEAAVKAAKQRRFDLAVTDLKMPGMDGIATVAALKEIDPEIEVIVATGFATVETAVSCMRKGAYDYITKPYDLTEMRLILERALERSRLQGAVALYEASKALLGTLRSEDLIRVVSDLAQRVLGADALGLVVNSEDSEPIVHWAGNVPDAPKKILELFAAETQRLGAPFRIPSSGEVSSLTLTECPEIVSALAYPLLARDRFGGALVLFRRAGKASFDGTELRRGVVFASQLAMALDNARLYGALELRLKELEATRHELVQAERHATVGKMVGFVAHEIASPLAVIRANLHSLKDYSTNIGALWASAKEASEFLLRSGSRETGDKLVQEIAEVVDDTLESTRRIADLVSGFQQLSGLSNSMRVESMDVTALIDDCVISAAKDVALNGITVQRETSSQPIRARGIRSDVQCSILNILKFLAERTKSSPGSNGQVSLGADLIEGQPYVWVKDPELSLTSEERSNLFDPKLEVSSQNGRSVRLDLGLAISYQLAQRSGGKLDVQTAEGSGTRFRLRLSSPGDKP